MIYSIILLWLFSSMCIYNILHYCIWLYMSCVLKSCYVYVYNVRNMRQLYLHKCVKINNICFSCLYGSVLLFFFYWCFFFIGKGGGVQWALEIEMILSTVSNKKVFFIDCMLFVLKKKLLLFETAIKTTFRLKFDVYKLHRHIIIIASHKSNCTKDKMHAIDRSPFQTQHARFKS